MTAQDDGAQHMDDEALLARAMSLNRVLVTSDHDFLSEVPRERQAKPGGGGRDDLSVEVGTETSLTDPAGGKPAR